MPVTASKIAYSLIHRNKKSIVVNDQIEIEPGDTALIYTKESIFLGNKLAGTCHNRVKMAACGLDNPGTPMFPGSSGKLLIAIHNQSKEKRFIPINNETTTVQNSKN